MLSPASGIALPGRSRLWEVGIILAFEVSRLACNSAGWYRPREPAALAGVPIADDGTVYDPRPINDRFLLV